MPRGESRSQEKEKPRVKSVVRRASRSPGKRLPTEIRNKSTVKIRKGKDTRIVEANDDLDRNNNSHVVGKNVRNVVLLLEVEHNTRSRGR